MTISKKEWLESYLKHLEYQLEHTKNEGGKMAYRVMITDCRNRIKEIDKAIK